MPGPARALLTLGFYTAAHGHRVDA